MNKIQVGQVWAAVKGVGIQARKGLKGGCHPESEASSLASPNWLLSHFPRDLSGPQEPHFQWQPVGHYSGSARWSKVVAVTTSKVCSGSHESLLLLLQGADSPFGGGGSSCSGM